MLAASAAAAETDPQRPRLHRRETVGDLLEARRKQRQALIEERKKKNEFEGLGGKQEHLITSRIKPRVVGPPTAGVSGSDSSLDNHLKPANGESDEETVADILQARLEMRKEIIKSTPWHERTGLGGKGHNKIRSRIKADLSDSEDETFDEDFLFEAVVLSVGSSESGSVEASGSLIVRPKPEVTRELKEVKRRLAEKQEKKRQEEQQQKQRKDSSSEGSDSDSSCSSESDNDSSSSNSIDIAKSKKTRAKY
jgi:hypothetical protein